MRVYCMHHVDVIFATSPLDLYPFILTKYIGISMTISFTAAHPKRVQSLIFFGTRVSFKRSVLLLLVTVSPNHQQLQQHLSNKEWHPMHVLPQQQLQQLPVVDLQLPPKILAHTRGQNQRQWLAANKGKEKHAVSNFFFSLVQTCNRDRIDNLATLVYLHEYRSKHHLTAITTIV